MCFAKGTSFSHTRRNSRPFCAILRSWVSKLETKGLPTAASETASAESASVEDDIATVDLILQTSTVEIVETFQPTFFSA